MAVSFVGGSNFLPEIFAGSLLLPMRDVNDDEIFADYADSLPA
jgi:hypothetical protein